MTEGGYVIDPATSAFDATAPEIFADAANPDRPATAFGAILAALKARRDTGVPPFTVMSCDNLPGNGHVNVPPVPGTDLGGYFDAVRGRFANPEVADTGRWLCLDGSNRQPKFILPAIRDGLAAGTPVAGLLLVSALWCRYCTGTTERGTGVPHNDPNRDRLQPLAQAARSDLGLWLGQRAIHGDLARDAAFRAAFAMALFALWTDGVEAVLRAYLGRG